MGLTSRWVDLPPRVFIHTGEAEIKRNMFPWSLQEKSTQKLDSFSPPGSEAAELLRNGCLKQGRVCWKLGFGHRGCGTRRHLDEEEGKVVSFSQEMADFARGTWERFVTCRGLEVRHHGWVRGLAGQTARCCASCLMLSSMYNGCSQPPPDPGDLRPPSDPLRAPAPIHTDT